MCGILGLSEVLQETVYTRRDREETISQCFEEALAILSHRGPDASGTKYFFDEGVFLGHTRLSIQDLSPAGTQPMMSLDEKYAITFNGEIYNFPVLKEKLEFLGYKFFSNTDTEVILNLYQEYGLDCFAMLDGIFALGIFDRQKNQLIISRDGLGIKPLYYYQDQSRLVFASEIKAIELFLKDVVLTLQKSNINKYLTFQWCPGEGTPFAEIKKHIPGETLVVTDGKIIDIKTFYRPPIFRPSAKNIKASVRSIISGLDANLRIAVHDQMLSDAPVGAFLSGGLDSTSIVAFAKEIDPNITCFTIDAGNAANDGMADDLPYARAAADHLKVPLEIVKVNPESLVQNLEKMVWMLDEPLGDPAPLNVFYISQLAKDNGIKVLLSGAGGDDILTGYRRHHAIMIDRQIQRLPKVLLSAVELFSGKLDKRVTLFRRLAKLFNGISLAGESRIINYFKWVDQGQLLTLYTNDFRNEIKNELAEQPMLDFLAHAHPSSTDLDKMLALEQRFFTTDHNLMYTDKMSMAAGVEVRVPLLANNLIEYAASISDNLKQNGRQGKWIFKKTMEAYLPKEIIYRPKTGFGAPLRSWLKFELRDYLEDLLSRKSLYSRGLFDPEAVHALISRNDKGQVDASYTIFSLMCIEIWCRQHVDFVDIAGSPRY
jgi:asparagine synthase (glutamine-hydrolysing)